MATVAIPRQTPEELFDEIGESYDDAYGSNTVLQKALERLVRRLNTGSSVLDVGCGPGGPASLMVRSGFDVTGIDISQNMIDLCNKNIPGTFYKADMTTFAPKKHFDAILSLYSMLQISHRCIYSLIFKLSSWLRPGGTLIIGTLTLEDFTESEATLEASGAYLERFEAPFMGKLVEVTLLTKTEWLSILQQAGLIIRKVERYTLDVENFGHKEPQVLITAERSHPEPLFGPYPLPLSRRPPHLLGEQAWEPFAKRLTRHEFDAVLNVVKCNKEVLDVGSGHGELPISIANQLGKSYAIEPNSDRYKLLMQSGRQSNVEVTMGNAEKLPYNARRFDAVVALWILHYVDNLEQALSEMTRVVNPDALNARLVIVQGAPDNEVVNLINRVCAPIAAEGTEENFIDHQGFLLATAARVFRSHGFGDITVSRVDAYCNFPEEDILTRCESAADVLTGFWYRNHPKEAEMKQAFIPVLHQHFIDQPYKVGDQAVLLIARPTRRTV